MFTATPRLRDLLDVRTVVLVALIAFGAFGLQLAFLAGTVASPLGGAIADLDRIPQFRDAPDQAFARTTGDRTPASDITTDGLLPWERPAMIAVDYRPPQACPVHR